MKSFYRCRKLQSFAFNYVKNETDWEKKQWKKTIVAYFWFSHRWPNLLDLDKK